MNLQLSESIRFEAAYLASGLVKTGLTVTVDVQRNGVAIVTGALATEAVNGVYVYILSSASTGTAGSYIATFKTADTTVDARHIHDKRFVGEPWIQNLDVATSTRNATTPPTAAANASAVRTELTTELGRIDATVSSRSTYNGADTSGTTTLLIRLPSALTVTGGKVDVNDKTGFALTVNEHEAIAAEIDLSGVATSEQAEAIDDYLHEKLTLPDPDGPVAVVPAPASPDLVTLYGYTTDFNLGAVAGVALKLEYLEKEIVVNNTFPRDWSCEATSDASGFFQFSFEDDGETKYGVPPSSAIRPSNPSKMTHRLSVTSDSETQKYQLRVADAGGDIAEMVR